MKNKIKHLDLFSGIGGFAITVARAGGITTAFSEVDKWCVQLLQKRFPKAAQLGDITQFDLPMTTRTPRGVEPVGRCGIHGAAQDWRIKNLRPKSWKHWTLERISSQVDFRARILATRANAPVLPPHVQVSGGTCAASSGTYAVPFAWFDWSTRLWRTWQRCLITGWTPYLETWPRAGMTRNGIAYRLVPLAPLTSEIGSGLWPTPVAQDDNKSPAAHMAMKARMKGGPRHKPTSLNVMVKGVELGMWPTPKATPSGPDFAAATRPGVGGDSLATAVARRMLPTPQHRDFRTGEGHRWQNEKRSRNLNDFVAAETGHRLFPTPTASDGSKGSPNQRHGNGGMTLASHAAMFPTPTVSGNNNRPYPGKKSGYGLGTVAKMYPTPAASDSKGGVSLERAKSKRLESSRGLRLPEHLSATEGVEVGGQLNPMWVEWLMAFPLGWTDLRASVTRLSQKRRNRQST